MAKLESVTYYIDRYQDSIMGSVCVALKESVPEGEIQLIKDISRNEINKRFPKKDPRAGYVIIIYRRALLEVLFSKEVRKVLYKTRNYVTHMCASDEKPSGEDIRVIVISNISEVEDTKNKIYETLELFYILRGKRLQLEDKIGSSQKLPGRLHKFSSLILPKPLLDINGWDEIDSHIDKSEDLIKGEVIEVEDNDKSVSQTYVDIARSCDQNSIVVWRSKTENRNSICTCIINAGIVESVVARDFLSIREDREKSIKMVKFLPSSKVKWPEQYLAKSVYGSVCSSISVRPTSDAEPHNFPVKVLLSCVNKLSSEFIGTEVLYISDYESQLLIKGLNDHHGVYVIVNLSKKTIVRARAFSKDLDAQIGEIFSIREIKTLESTVKEYASKEGKSLYKNVDFRNILRDYENIKKGTDIGIIVVLNAVSSRMVERIVKKYGFQRSWLL